MFPGPKPLFGFVWRPQELTESVIDLARHTSSRAIFDFSNHSPAQAATALQKDVRDIKLSVDQFMDPVWEDLLSTANPDAVWVEYHPALYPQEPELFIEAIHRSASQYKCVPVVGELDLLFSLLTLDPGLEAVALKGNESSGFVGSETTGILYATMREWLCRRRGGTDLLIWGGIATPEAAAAFLSTGASGIVFESLHWLTDFTQIDSNMRDRIAKLHQDHTSLVGSDLGVICRILDKGNSLAAKRVRQYAGSLGSDEITDEKRYAFARHVAEKSLSALESNLGRTDLVFVGTEVTFAQAFVERFGMNCKSAIKGFLTEVKRLWKQAPNMKDRFIDSPTAKHMGTIYPFIQGAMTWISDVPDFARAVAEAGGLPTLALGLKDRSQLENDLANLRKVMAGRPYSVNFITLDENPYRDEQLAWIEKNRPPFVVIAAGDPAYAARLTEAGISVFYITSDHRLLRMALDAGIPYVILEGNEAGGHVGTHSTLTLAQIMLVFKHQNPEMFTYTHVVLAGGIFDRESAFRATMMGADAIQLGTAYIATEEIVTTGAIRKLYQQMILEAAPGDTVITGDSIGFRVRSLNTPKIKAIHDLERRYMAGEGDELEFRQRLESLSAHSLLMAARGIDRQGGSIMAEASCRLDGQFMSGAVAGVIHRIYSVADLHKDLAEAHLDLTVPQEGQDKTPTTTWASRPVDHPERVAITGMAIANSLGNGLEDFWQAVSAMKSGIVEVPSHKWDHNLYYDPDPRAPDKSYCKIGAFMELEIDRKDLRISPMDFRSMSNSTKLSLWLAHHAIDQSGILESGIPRERIGVLISQNSGESASTLPDIVIGLAIKRILRGLVDVFEITPEKVSDVEQRIKSNLLSIDDTTLLGRLNSAAGGFICQKYGFMGPSYAVSAACATSLVALYSAIQMVKNGVLDAAVLGGGEESLNLDHYLEFGALGALAGLSGRRYRPEENSRPFDVNRDGMVLGEGGGMIVLERESVARARGAKIHAFITGVGASNNIRGMVESLAETQQIAVRAAFTDSGYGPDQVDLVECHATGTVQGDIEEVKALKRIFPEGKRTVLSSLKSQIGHTLGASGISSLIRGVMAMQERVYPGTLNYHIPDPAIALEGWGFRVLESPDEWIDHDGRPRRFQVNAFGFGGANYVVQLEECQDESDMVLTSPDGRLLPNHRQDPPGVFLFKTRKGPAAYRLGVIADSLRHAQTKVEKYLPLSASGHKTDGVNRRLVNKGIFLGQDGAPAPPMALVFTGQGSHYTGMSKELFETFPVIRRWMECIAEVADFDLLDILFNGSEEILQQTRWQQPLLFTMEYAMAQYLLSLGIKPVALAGHSVGELTALCIAGVFTWESGFRIVDKRAELMAKAGRLSKDPGAMIAVKAPLAALKEMIAPKGNIFFTNYNSPHQVVLGGGTKEILTLDKTLEENGYQSTRLKVSMAFHSPILKVICDEFEEFLAPINMHAPRITVISNTTNRPFPKNPVKIKDVLIRQIKSPVQFMQNIQTLWNLYNIKLFLEVGPGDTLSNLIIDTMGSAQCIPTCYRGNEVHTYSAALAKLFSLRHLNAWHQPIKIPFPTQKSISPSKTKVQKTGIVNSTQSAAANNHMENVIQIIMDATGYEREEIEPDMDLRQDLAIRSSRLPVIMDTAERLFGIAIRLEDFITVRTVQDLVERIAWVMERDGTVKTAASYTHGEPLAPAAEGIQAAPVGKGAFHKKAPLRRLVFTEVPLDHTVQNLVNIKPGQDVGVLSLGGDSVLASEAARALKTEFNIRPFIIHISEAWSNLNTPDQNSPTWAEQMIQRLAEAPSSAGLVMVMNYQKNTGFGHMENTTALLTGLFRVLQAFLRLPKKAFCLVLQRSLRADHPATVAFEGVLGMFLAAAQEYNSVLFRSVALDKDTDMESACRAALDADYPLVQQIYHGQDSFTLKAVARPNVFADNPTMKFDKGDVVVLSGGGKGITARLAAGLAPFKPRLVLLGRTRLDDIADYEKTLAAQVPPEDAARDLLKKQYPNLKGEAFENKKSEFMANMDVHCTLHGLSQQGLETIYCPCDVTNLDSVTHALADVVERYGRIDGIIHGAGVLHDAFMEFMTPEDFARVAAVKLAGAWNLYQIARPHGLRFMVVLSSIAAILGNIGQANYCAANRALSALMRAIKLGPGRVSGKALILPPIEGTGMANDLETRAFMELRGMAGAYIHANELTEMFLRELFVAPVDHTWVMLTRALPQVKSVQVEVKEPPLEKDTFLSVGTLFRSGDFPMIRNIHLLDPGKGELEVERNFEQEYDLWLEDHKPFKFMQYPIVSGIMIVEAFLEIARIRYPYLRVKSVREVEYRGILECPPNKGCQTHILCRSLGVIDGDITCDISLMSQGISPSGRFLDHRVVKSKGKVVMGLTAAPAVGENDLNVEKDELTSPAIHSEKARDQYQQHTTLQGRYRVLDQIDGTGPGIIRGSMVYREHIDFAGLEKPQYSYSPYLLEALVHMVAFYHKIIKPDTELNILPVGFKEMRFIRPCRPQERIILMGRMRSQDEKGQVWDAQAKDETGAILMQVRGIYLQWLAN